MRYLGLTVQQPSWRSGFSPSWWSSSSHTSLSCFLNQVTHQSDNNTEFCFTLFILYKKKSGIKLITLIFTCTTVSLTHLCCVQVYQTRGGSPSPPRQRCPIRRKGCSGPLILFPTLVTSVQETVLWP